MAKSRFIHQIFALVAFLNVALAYVQGKSGIPTCQDVRKRSMLADKTHKRFYLQCTNLKNV